MTHVYKCLVKFGHAGSGKYLEMPIFIRARNIMEALERTKRFRGVKKGNLYRTGASVLQINQAS
mgnify:FL=1